jgi:hypothetical protein
MAKAAAVLESEEAETLTLSDFQPSYDYSEDEIELVSLPDYLEIKFNGEVIKRVNIPSHLHKRYYVSYKKDLKRKLQVLAPYLSGIESFLTMVVNLPASKQNEIESEIKCEIYRLP